MLAFLPYPVRGAFVILLIILSTVIQFPFLMTAALLKLILPFDAARKFCTWLITAIAENWIFLNGRFLELVKRRHWHILGNARLNPKDWYLITCNHQSWSDILILQETLRGKVPFLKFFLKQELIWVPLIGLAWWALDFPFMKRYTKAQVEKNPALKGKDLETTRQACAKFRTIPVSVFNFMEGTRFTPDKHLAQQSPYRHLLKPKAGGTAFVLGAMGNELKTLLNITIYYPQGRPGFWALLDGRLDEAYVDIEALSIPEEFRSREYMEDEAFRLSFQQWVTELWEQKDRKLGELERQYAKRQP